MKNYWRTRQSMIARMHSIGKLPKELRKTITLRPEDHVLLISSNSTELYGESEINLKSRSIKKKYQAILFFSKNIFQIVNLISHKFPGDPEEKTAEIHYSVSVIKSASYLLREGLISNYEGMNEIDTLALSEVVESNLNPFKDDIFGPTNLDDMRDPRRKMESENQLGTLLQKTLSEFGIELIGKPSIRWSETSTEMLESFKSARRAEIEANEEVMRLEQESSLSNAQIQAQGIAQKKLKKSRRQLVKKERAFLQAQLQANHQIKIQDLELEKEKILMEKRHEVELLKQKMKNEMSEIELEKIINERFADEEKRLLLEQERAQSKLEQKTNEMEMFYQQQQLELDLNVSRAKNIESERILSDFDRDEKIKTAKAEVEINRIEQQTKTDNLKQLMEIKAMHNQMKAEKQIERKSKNEIISPCGTLRFDSGEWVPLEAGTNEEKSSSEAISQKGKTQTISNNILGGDLNMKIEKSKEDSSDSTQNISGNIISGNMNAKIDSDEEN